MKKQQPKGAVSSRPKGAVKFKKLTSQQRIEIENIKRKNRPSEAIKRTCYER